MSGLTKHVLGTTYQKIYRHIDSKRRKFPGIASLILQKQHDPNRTAGILVLLYPNGSMLYILAPTLPATQTSIYNLKASKLIAETGWSSTLNNFPSGTVVHNIELIPGLGGQISRSAGNGAIIIKRSESHRVIKLKSGAQRGFSIHCMAVKGIASNANHFLQNLQKAGTAHKLGHRPHTRACAKNPVDHPLGGRTRGGAQPQNRNGILNNISTAGRHKGHKLQHISGRSARLAK